MNNQDNIKCYIPKIAKGRMVYSPSYKTRVLEYYFKRYALKDSCIKKIPVQASMVTIFDNLKKTLRTQHEYTHILRLDIKNFFGTIKTNRMLSLLSTYTDEFGLELAKEYFLKERFVAGSTLSNLFASIYIKDALDEFNEQGLKYLRYVDDFIFFCTSEENANEILKKVTAIFDKYDLAINEKTYIRDKRDSHNLFLGFNFFYYEQRKNVIIKCKKNTQKKIEKRYQLMKNELYDMYLQGKNSDDELNTFIRKLNNYTLNIFYIYYNISSSLASDFKFSNRIIKDMANLIGFTGQRIYKTRNSGAIYLLYDDTFSLNLLPDYIYLLDGSHIFKNAHSTF